MPMDIYYYDEHKIDVAKTDLLTYENRCLMCNLQNSNHIINCCKIDLCEDCYTDFLQKKNCPYCNENIFLYRIKNCFPSCDKNQKLIMFFFAIWYIINFISFYLLYYYVYQKHIDVNLFMLILIISMNSSIAIIVILFTLISLSIDSFTYISTYFKKEDVDITDEYISYDEL
jgi:hypothetical protein